MVLLLVYAQCDALQAMRAESDKLLFLRKDYYFLKHKDKSNVWLKQSNTLILERSSGVMDFAKAHSAFIRQKICLHPCSLVVLGGGWWRCLQGRSTLKYFTFQSWSVLEQLGGAAGHYKKSWQSACFASHKCLEQFTLETVLCLEGAASATASVK